MIARVEDELLYYPPPPPSWSVLGKKEEDLAAGVYQALAQEWMDGIKWIM